VCFFFFFFFLFIFLYIYIYIYIYIHTHTRRNRRNMPKVRLNCPEASLILINVLRPETAQVWITPFKALCSSLWGEFEVIFSLPVCRLACSQLCLQVGDFRLPENKAKITQKRRQKEISANVSNASGSEIHVGSRIQEPCEYKWRLINAY
jgi:hypothetical protein